jgi:hypothetical protein
VFCSKCGAEVRNGSSSCSKCGARIGLPKLGLPLLPLSGAVALSVSPFLPWVPDGWWRSLGSLGWPHSESALYVLGALVFLVTILARENERRLSTALAVLGALSLALVFTSAYKISIDEPPIPWGDVGQGFYVAGVGAFLTTLAACPLFRRIVVSIPS